MRAALLVSAAVIAAAGCAVVIGDGSVACVDFDNRAGLAVSPSASGAAGGLTRRTGEQNGAGCRTSTPGKYFIESVP